MAPGLAILDRAKDRAKEFSTKAEKTTCGHFELPLDTASRDDETRKRKRRNGKSRTKTNASADGIGKHAL